MKPFLRNAVVLAFTTLPLAWVGNTHGQSSASYEITCSVMSGGGGRSSSASYSLTGTLGQPSPVEASEGDTYNLGSGFWGGMVKMFTVAMESISYGVAEGVRITWQSIAGATYTVYYTEDLMAVWEWLADLGGTGAPMEWTDDGTLTPAHPGEPYILKRFYRVKGEPPGP